VGVGVLVKVGVGVGVLLVCVTINGRVEVGVTVGVAVGVGLNKYANASCQPMLRVSLVSFAYTSPSSVETTSPMIPNTFFSGDLFIGNPLGIKLWGI
jgi:hypothetical protein